MRVRLNKKGFIIYILILTGSVIYASFYGGLLPFILLYGVLLFLPVSVLCIVLNYHFLSVYQELPVHRVLKGDRHEFLMSFENTGILPIHDMELILHSDRCGFEGIRDGERISIEPRTKKKLSTKIVCLYGGSYNIGIKSLGFSDAFGIMTIIVNVPYIFKAIVSPKITDAADAYMDIENIMNSVGSKSDVKTEEIPGSDMRDYYPGDPKKTINWKVSARLERLTVRIPDKQDTKTITLILEAVNVPESLQDTEYLRRRDHFLEFAVSAAWFFARRGVPVRMIYPAGKITERQVDSYESFREFYNEVSGGISYRSDDEKDRMHAMTQERRNPGYGDGTRVIIIEDEWPGEDFCIVAD